MLKNFLDISISQFDPINKYRSLINTFKEGIAKLGTPVSVAVQPKQQIIHIVTSGKSIGHHRSSNTRSKKMEEVAHSD